LQAGKLRPLAVTSAEPSAVLPDVPTLASVLPGFVDVTWWAVLGPAGMPLDVATKLSRSLLHIAREQDFVKALTDRGGMIVAGGPDNLRAAIQAEAGKTGKLIKELGIAAQ
jgi:tripartite-type tricarboxylate transporter receptor subunit TctC